MTALAEALLAAQRQAIGALSKAYVAGVLDAEGLAEKAATMGTTDVVELAQLLHALDVLKEYGVPAPAPTPESRKAPTPMTDPQRARIERDCKNNNLPLPPDMDVMNSRQASAVIKAIENGTYDPTNFVIPV